MKTITQNQDDIKTLRKKVGDIDAKCTMENRQPVDSEVALKNEILDTIEEIRKMVETQERQERVFGELEKPANAPESRPKPVERSEERSKKDRFATFGEQLAAVMRSGIPGGHTDPRLYQARDISGLSETVPSDGGLR